MKLHIRIATYVMLLITITVPTIAGPQMHQIVTTSWPGLSGLYMIPTARTLQRGQLAIGFNEAKHAEFVNNGHYVDRQIRGVVTYGITDNLEIYATRYNDLIDIPEGVEPNTGGEVLSTFGFKYRLMDEHPHYWFPAVSIGVRDIANQTRDIAQLEGVNNGRKVFLLASKKMLKNEDLGRFMDVHAGLAWDEEQISAVLGFELTLTPSVSLIAESMWDSSFINFERYGETDVPGKYVFDVGMRAYPELVPGLVLDTGFVGDGEFEFSFGISYMMSL